MCTGHSVGLRAPLQSINDPQKNRHLGKGRPPSFWGNHTPPPSDLVSRLFQYLDFRLGRRFRKLVAVWRQPSLTFGSVNQPMNMSTAKEQDAPHSPTQPRSNYLNDALAILGDFSDWVAILSSKSSSSLSDVCYDLLRNYIMIHRVYVKKHILGFCFLSLSSFILQMTGQKAVVQSTHTHRHVKTCWESWTGLGMSLKEAWLIGRNHCHIHR